MKILRIVLIFFALQAPAMISQAETRPAQIETAAGPVRIVADGEARILLLRNSVLYRGTDFMRVNRYVRLKSCDVILIRDFVGPVACPVRFLALGLRRGGGWHLSAPFGDCADDPDIEVDRDNVTIHFRAFGPLPASTWRFDGRQLFKRKEPAPPKPG
ncbi:MAG: hypothetical protein KKB20_17800 [Proteobacteria bacterium]|nr:hypothetical protein [Pseudomonadota bacterium]